MHRLRRALVLLAILVAPVTLHGQDMPTPPAAADTTSALRLFLDCASVGCDFDFLRTELTWVSYVRDRTDAQVHVISTSLGSGGGGSEVTLKFVGQKEFAGLDDEIKFNNKQGATSDETRKEFTRVLKIGLARYVLRTPRGASLAINYNVPSANIPQAPVRDPWNHWVFSLGGNAFLNGESQSKTRYLSGNLSAGRVTEDWKFRVSFSGTRTGAPTTWAMENSSRPTATATTPVGCWSSHSDPTSPPAPRSAATARHSKTSISRRGSRRRSSTTSCHTASTPADA